MSAKLPEEDEPDIMEELKDLTPEQLKALIAMVKNAENACISAESN